MYMSLSINAQISVRYEMNHPVMISNHWERSFLKFILTGLAIIE